MSVVGKAGFEKLNHSAWRLADAWLQPVRCGAYVRYFLLSIDVLRFEPFAPSSNHELRYLYLRKPESQKVLYTHRVSVSQRLVQPPRTGVVDLNHSRVVSHGQVFPLGMDCDFVDLLLQGHSISRDTRE